jgi:hypothetical protein
VYRLFAFILSKMCFGSLIFNRIFKAVGLYGHREKIKEYTLFLGITLATKALRKRSYDIPIAIITEYLLLAILGLYVIGELVCILVTSGVPREDEGNDEDGDHDSSGTGPATDLSSEQQKLNTFWSPAAAASYASRRTKSPGPPAKR